MRCVMQSARNGVSMSITDKLKHFGFGVPSQVIDNTRPLSEYFIVPPGWQLYRDRLYNRHLTQDEMDAIDADPFALFRPNDKAQPLTAIVAPSERRSA
jgi:hypothetical protein